jgi:capsular exopolysaccharide synthesis family protein
VELQDYLRVLRGRWRLVALCVLIGLAMAASLSIVQTPKYRANAQLFVAARSSDLTGIYQGDLFSQQRVKSYTDIVNSPQVINPVLNDLHLSMTEKQVAREVSASAPANTVLLNIHVTDREPARAQAIANAVAQQFSTLASELETPAGATSSPVRVTVVKSATLPTSPVSPRTTRDIALGFLLGLLVGIAAAVLRETLDTSVKHLEDLTQELDLAPLGVVLYDPEAIKRPLILEASAQSSRAEAFRQLRTNLQFVDVDSAPRSIVVTSSVPEEGKSTTTANLAISLAQAGVRVCLVEGDLRRPRLMQYLGLESAVGLTSVLIGRAQLSDVIQPFGNGKLHVLTSGPTPPNPSELLGARSMADVLAELEEQFDLVIIDAPPLLPVTDAAVLASLTSGTLLVVRYGKTRREQVRRAVEALRAVDARIYGIVLNMAPAKGPDAYYYGYAYRYDYKPTADTDLRPAVRRHGPDSDGHALGAASTPPPASAPEAIPAATEPTTPPVPPASPPSYQPAITPPAAEPTYQERSHRETIYPEPVQTERSYPAPSSTVRVQPASSYPDEPPGSDGGRTGTYYQDRPNDER